MSERHIPGPNEIYRHFKGNLYRVVTLAEHTETGEQMVIYQALYGDYQIYARPLELFTGRVDHEKYPEAAEEFRFTLIPEILGQGRGQATADMSAQSAEPGAGTGVRAAEPEADTGVNAAAPAKEEAQNPEPEEAASENAVQNPSADMEPEEEFSLDPTLVKFLDADTYEEKLDILVGVHNRITDDMLNTMAVSLDLDLEEGDPEERYQTLKNCLVTLEKYECNRLR